MLVIYVAGPFRGPTQWDIAENIRAAERIGLLVALAGAMPLIPHANTAHFHGQRDAQFWLDGTLELLRRSNGAVFIPGWRKSSGSIGEFREAGRLFIPRLQLDDYHEDAFRNEIVSFVNRLSHDQEQKSEEQRAAVQAAGH